MKNSPNIPAKAQIRNLLIVIGSGVIFALAIAFIMLASYGPSGKYFAKNVLLSPETAKVMKYDGLIFDHVDFSQWNSESKVWDVQRVSLPIYQRLYAEVEGDQSVKEIHDDVIRLFNRNPTALTVLVRSDAKQVQGQGHTFQVLQFASNGDYYRVELRAAGNNESSEWAYFNHVGLKDKFVEMLAQEGN